MQRLKKYFGSRWYLSILSILLFILWPTVIFYNEISIDPPLFVTNWLTTTFGSLLIAIILKIYFVEIANYNNKIIINFLNDNIKRLIKKLIISLSINEQFNAIYIKNLWDDTNENLRNLKDENLLKDTGNLYTIIRKNEQEKIDDFIRIIQFKKNLNDINNHDLQEIIYILNKILNRIE